MNKNLQTVKTFESRFQDVSSKLVDSMPKYAQITPDRLLVKVTSMLKENPRLQNCDVMSFYGAVFSACELGLIDLPGACYIIPYGEKAQFQLGYKGAKELFYRNPNCQNLTTGIIRENDEYEVLLGDEQKLIHKRDWLKTEDERGQPIAYYAVATVKGTKSFFIMSKNEVEVHRNKYSKNWRNKDSAWSTAFDPMALKTVEIKLFNNLPSTVEINKALMLDNSFRNINGEVYYDTEENIAGSNKPYDWSAGEELEVGKNAKTIKAKIVEDEPVFEDDVFAVSAEQMIVEVKRAKTKEELDKKLEEFRENGSTGKLATGEKMSYIKACQEQAEKMKG